MKIFVIQESNWLARNPHQQHHLMERLAAKGHVVRVIDYDIDWKKNDRKGITRQRTVYENVQKIIPDVSITVIRPWSLNLPFFEYPALVIAHRQEIARQINEFKPDMIIGFGILNAWIAARLARHFKIPFIYYWIDALDTLIPEKIFQRLGRFLERQTLQNSSKVIAINKTLREYAINLGANREQTSLIGAGIDLNRFDPLVNGSEIRSAYGMGKDDIVLIFMGWLYHYSGLKEVGEELAKVKETYPTLKLFIVGDGDAYEDLKVLRDKKNLGDRMILAGRQPFEKIPQLIAAADICLLPAYDNEIMHDIVPIKMYEYLAMGKPVVATKLHGIMNEFGEKNGVVFIDSPQQALQKSMEMICDGSSLSEGERGRIFVEKLDWKDITEVFERELESLI